MELTHGSLFAGIGGFDLGFERAGFKSVWQVEIDPYCRAVLAKHFPGAKRYEDVRQVGKANLDSVDVISGGFPCQDISNAGKRAGITGSRSGLWVEFRRIIDELRPRYVVVENVAALYQRGLDRVLGDLAESGYDAEWDCLPAAAFGAPHLRERLWIIAYPKQSGTRVEKHNSSGRSWLRASMPSEPAVLRQGDWSPSSEGIGADNSDVADTSKSGQLRAFQLENYQARERGGGRSDAHAGGQVSRADAANPTSRILTGFERWGESGVRPERLRWWDIEPNVGRVVNGLPLRVERLKCLGNAIVPAIAEEIAWRIREVMEANS